MSQSFSDRFYQTVDHVADGDTYLVLLDGRSPKSPGGARLWLSTAAAARLVAKEWDQQETKINLSTMPFTQLAFAALDQVQPHQDHVVLEIAAYGGSDLICFLAEQPSELIEKQKAAWLPLHDWFAETWQTTLAISRGIIATPQAPQTLQAIERAVRQFDPFQLAAVHGLTKLSGSIIIALAVTRGRLDAEEAWPASRIDEDWQIGRWGHDAEADRLAEEKKKSFYAAASFFKAVS